MHKNREAFGKPKAFLLSRHISTIMGLMITVFLIGNIASGKSSAARYLESRGAYRIDLDQECKELYVPGSSLVRRIALEFGGDVLDECGCIRPPVLAERAFADAASTARLEAIVYPALIERLRVLLASLEDRLDVHSLVIVEVSAPSSFSEAFSLADAVLAIAAPFKVRRDRALLRGMSEADFDARAAIQPSEVTLRSLATSVIENTGTEAEFHCALDAWAASLRSESNEIGGAHD